jgi:hypothetical protein
MGRGCLHTGVNWSICMSALVSLVLDEMDRQRHCGIIIVHGVPMFVDQRHCGIITVHGVPMFVDQRHCGIITVHGVPMFVDIVGYHHPLIYIL